MPRAVILVLFLGFISLIPLSHASAQENCLTLGQQKYGVSAAKSFACMTSSKCDEKKQEDPDTFLYDFFPNTLQCGTIGCCVKVDKDELQIDEPAQTGQASATGSAAEAAAAAQKASPGSPTTLFNPLGTTSLFELIRRVVQAFLGILGASALLVFVYAGILWMTGGSGDRIQKAKDTMKYAVIGLFIIGFAYGLSTFIVDILIGNITTPEPEPVQFAEPPKPNP